MNDYSREGNRDRGQVGAYVAAAHGYLPFIQKVYALLLGCILLAIASGSVLFMGPKFTVGNTNLQVTAAMAWAVGHMRLIFWITLGTLFVASMVRRTPGLNLILLLAFSALAGLMVAPMVFSVTISSGPGTVGLAAALTFLAFATMTTLAFTSRTDFNFLGAGLFVAVLGLFVGSLLNAYVFKSLWMNMVIAWVGVVAFSAYILYDTNQILRRAEQETVPSAALNLFVDVLNLFMMILSLLGGRRQ